MHPAHSPGVAAVPTDQRVLGSFHFIEVVCKTRTVISIYSMKV